MKKIFIIAALVLVCGNMLFAQEKKQKMSPEQRREMFVYKMQQKLMLDDATAAKFVPLYKEYLQAMAECRPACGKCENPSDEQIKEKIAKRLDAREKAIDVEKKYFKKFSAILNGRQLQEIFCFDKKESFKKGAGRSFGKGTKGSWEKGGKCGRKPAFGKKQACGSKPVCDRMPACGEKPACDKKPVCGKKPVGCPKVTETK